MIIDYPEYKIFKCSSNREEKNKVLPSNDLKFCCRKYAKHYKDSIYTVFVWSTAEYQTDASNKLTKLCDHY